MPRVTPGSTAAAAALALLALAGCAGDDGDTGRGAPATTTTATSDTRVVAPGRPGETADVIEPGEDIEIVEGGYSEIDVRFVEQMIPHHRQALTMAELAADRAQDERVLLVADRIIAGQGAEITVLENWLEQRGLPVPPAGAEHDHGLPGMITPLQLEQLTNTSGAEFDELFLTYMSQHHAGAIEMADAAVAGGTDQLALELATDVSVTQGVEIDRMREILDTL
ncbi:DUF305 domain-containing protein [Jiangella rhizosphaerae]|uniref:DUF305 domain-containing protein n=1 Tax=Jiangella rhizosphaerae TaxID=2293569 RepID=A0A418KMT1_9ACTN|nr:DUF305 domain-containing protein [Jiangella rhizosphaerae]RIQ20213.1 DUF305 domain-containing protein [Jiangella rhizosphaerae]